MMGITNRAREASRKSNRVYFDQETKKSKIFSQSVSVMKATIETLKEQMKVSNDPNISISSASEINPIHPKGNKFERINIANSIRTLTENI